MNNKERKTVKIKTLKIKNLTLILSIILLVISLTKTISFLIYMLIPYGGIFLISNGIDIIISSIICSVLYEKRKNFTCPICGKSKIRYRKLNTTTYDKTKYCYNYYTDFYVCPNCKNVTSLKAIKYEKIKK